MRRASEGEPSSVLVLIGYVGGLLTLAVIVASAYLRLAWIGLDCEPWPSCYGLRVADPRAVLPQDTLTVSLRVLHRLAASGVAIAALAALAASWRRTPRSEVTASVAIVALALGLAVLGRAAGASVSAPVALGNVLGGMAMFALFCRFAFKPAYPQRPRGDDAPLKALAVAALTLLAIQIALGVMTSTQLAGRACEGLLSCEAAAAATAAELRVLNPLHALGSGDESARALLQLAHHVIGLLTIAAVTALAVALWRDARKRSLAVMLIALALLELALGAALVLFDLRLVWGTAHNAFAAILLGATVRAIYWRSADAASVSALCQMRTSNQPSGTNVQR